MSDFWYQSVKILHIACVGITLLLFVLRFYWRCTSQALMLQTRIIKTLPHLNDTLLLISGGGLIYLTGYDPFSPLGQWLGEKLIGIVIYIILGHIALTQRSKRRAVYWSAFLFAILCFYTIILLAIRKIPLFIGLV